MFGPDQTISEILTGDYIIKLGFRTTFSSQTGYEGMYNLICL